MAVIILIAIGRNWEPVLQRRGFAEVVFLVDNTGNDIQNISNQNFCQSKAWFLTAKWEKRGIRMLIQIYVFQVECSIQNSFEKGMSLEIANKLPEGSYWVASILMSCGQLLRLRLLGCGEDGSADFWCDITTWDVHQLGWCNENSKTVCPPEGKNPISSSCCFFISLSGIV